MRAFVAQHRIGISRAWFLLILLLILFAQPVLLNQGAAALIVTLVGFVLMTVAALGRLWCSIYICGYKNRRVIQDGPYSVVRNPLYVFSLLGAIGIGLTAQSLVITGLILVFFIGIYPLTVADEEERLERLLGEEYVAYKSRTPRFVPAFGLFKNVEQYTINLPQMQNAFKDALWFFLGFAVLRLIDLAHGAGILPAPLWLI